MTTNENNHTIWKRLFGATGLKVVLVLFAVFWLIVVAASWAESAELPSVNPPGAQAPSQSTDRAPAALEDENSEYNFNWLDPEKKIYVLQNRKYTKAGHVFLNLMAGPGLSNPYRTTWNLDPRIDYYFSEAFGIEMFWAQTFNTQNNTFTALQSASNSQTVPVVRELKSELGFMAQWVPWYAKINVFNKILYFDWYFQAGGGQISANLIVPPAVAGGASSTQSQNMFALYAGTGHLYHLTQDVTVRLDFTGAYYHAPLQGNTGTSTWFSNYNFEIGFGYRL
jgi:outer membrane beta-barrel protein